MKHTRNRMVGARGYALVTESVDSYVDVVWIMVGADTMYGLAPESVTVLRGLLQRWEAKHAPRSTKTSTRGKAS